MTEAQPQGAGLEPPRDHINYEPGKQNIGHSTTRPVQIGTMNSHKQDESRSTEEASSIPGLNEDSIEQAGPETLSVAISPEDRYEMSTLEHGKDSLSEEIRASIRSLEDRMKQLEDGKAQPPRPKIDLNPSSDQGAPANEQDSKAPEKILRPPTRIIPQLKYLGWHEFMNKPAHEEEAYAIEILIGRARYHHQRVEDEKKDEVKGGIHGQNERAERPVKLDDEACASEASTPKEVPERIRIRSTPVLHILLSLTLYAPQSAPMVYLRPFKHLVYFEAQLREKYHRLETKWGSYKAADQVRNDAEASKPLHSPLMAKEGESQQSQTIESSTTHHESASGQGLKISTEVPAETGDDRCLKDSRVESTFSHTTKVGNSGLEDKPVLNEEAQKGTESKDQTESVAAFRELRCLLEFIDNELKPVVEDYKTRRREKVYFSELWYLFKPGDLLYTPLDNKADTEVARSLDRDSPGKLRKAGARFQEVWRIDITADGRPNLRPPVDDEPTVKKINAFKLHAYHVDLNWTRTYAAYKYLFRIDAFPGQRDILSLPCYPLDYLANADHLRSKWKARGEAFREFHTFVHKYYIGRSLTSHPNGDCHPRDDLPRHAENIDSQVVIDFSEAYTANPGWHTEVDSDPAIDYTLAEFEDEYRASYWTDENRKELYKTVYEDIAYDWIVDDLLSEEQRSHDKLMENKREVVLTEHSELSDEHLILLPNRVFALVLRNRKFAMLTVGSLRPIKPHVDGFNDLKLPKGHKGLVKSLVYNHFINKGAEVGDEDDTHENDVVRGKGKGLILLLHGAPGVGKTSTAECVTEANGKMLFPITCGDLGTTAADVERELSNKFHLAELWDCVLLLDEADVFLAQRTKYDVKRNSLVSVFLRVLEYFTGILFLTTNRVGAFDEAFKSRIHVSLYYPPLDWAQTDAIWRMHMRRSIEKKARKGIILHIDEPEILTFAKRHYLVTASKKAKWNGRQIRNAFQTATSLAEYEAHEHKSKQNKARSLEQTTTTELELKVDHFERVAWASFEFDKYLAQTHALTDTELAFQNAERTDQFRSSQGSFSRREQQSFPTSASISTPRSDPRPWTQSQQQRTPRPAQAPAPLSYTQNVPLRMEASRMPTQDVSRGPEPETAYDYSWQDTTPWPAGSLMAQADQPEERELFAPQVATRRQAMGDMGAIGNASMYGYGDEDEGY